MPFDTCHYLDLSSCQHNFLLCTYFLSEEVIQFSINFLQVSTHRRSVCRRQIFEDNLRNEGLVLEAEPRDPSGLHFVKIRAPLDVLKRYAEILKLRLPMKKVFVIEVVEICIGKLGIS